MKHIQESIIGRRSAYRPLRSLKDLQYGDVVEIYDGGKVSNYIYIPMDQIKHHTFTFDGFVRYDKNSLGCFCYRKLDDFKRSFPESETWGEDVKINRYITHINEWQSISDGYDIKNLFDKYNISINIIVVKKKTYFTQ